MRRRTCGNFKSCTPWHLRKSIGGFHTDKSSRPQIWSTFWFLFPVIATAICEQMVVPSSQEWPKSFMEPFWHYATVRGALCHVVRLSRLLRLDFKWQTVRLEMIKISTHVKLLHTRSPPATFGCHRCFRSPTCWTSLWLERFNFMRRLWFYRFSSSDGTKVMCLFSHIFSKDLWLVKEDIKEQMTEKKNTN